MAPSAWHAATVTEPTLGVFVYASRTTSWRHPSATSPVRAVEPQAWSLPATSTAYGNSVVLSIRLTPHLSVGGSVYEHRLRTWAGARYRYHRTNSMTLLSASKPNHPHGLGSRVASCPPMTGWVTTSIHRCSSSRRRTRSIASRVLSASRVGAASILRDSSCSCRSRTSLPNRVANRVLAVHAVLHHRHDIAELFGASTAMTIDKFERCY